MNRKTKEITVTYLFTLPEYLTKEEREEIKAFTIKYWAKKRVKATISEAFEE